MPRKLPTFLDADEPEKLLAATTTFRDRVLCLTILTLGLRVSEVTKLEVAHVDFRRKLVWVREGKGQKDRVLPLPRVLAGPLRGWLGARKAGYVFPSPRRGGRLSSRAVQLLLKRLAVRAGLRDATKPRRVRPHALRHAFASRTLEAGATIYEVKELLGHSSISTTEVYLHTSPERLRSAVDRVYE